MPRGKLKPASLLVVLAQPLARAAIRSGALLRSLERVDRTWRAFLSQLIRIRLAVVVVGLVFYPLVHINGVRHHGEDRKFLIALLTKYTVPFDCRHNRITPYFDY